jgi:hypothetical protein
MYSHTAQADIPGVKGVSTSTGGISSQAPEIKHTHDGVLAQVADITFSGSVCKDILVNFGKAIRASVQNRYIWAVSLYNRNFDSLTLLAPCRFCVHRNGMHVSLLLCRILCTASTLALCCTLTTTRTRVMRTPSTILRPHLRLSRMSSALAAHPPPEDPLQVHTTTLLPTRSIKLYVALSDGPLRI